MNASDLRVAKGVSARAADGQRGRTTRTRPPPIGYDRRVPIDEERLRLIRSRHGQYGSWALWAEPNEGRPKSNVGDLSVFSVGEAKLSQLLNPSVVLVGLNISRRVQQIFGNFHDPGPRGMDYKLRHALRGTSLWGGYLTDVIKDFEQKASGRVMSYLRKNESFERENLHAFRAELQDLGSTSPTIWALGASSFEIMKRGLGGEYEIGRLPHYSNYIGREGYRAQVLTILGVAPPLGA